MTYGLRGNIHADYYCGKCGRYIPSTETTKGTNRYILHSICHFRVRLKPQPCRQIGNMKHRQKKNAFLEAKIKQQNKM